jgi:hypothetical protein
VNARRPGADPQSGADLPVGQAHGEQSQDVQLALGQPVLPVLSGSGMRLAGRAFSGYDLIKAWAWARTQLRRLGVSSQVSVVHDGRGGRLI